MEHNEKSSNSVCRESIYKELKRRFIISVVAERPRLHTTHKKRMALSDEREKREVKKRCVEDDSRNYSRFEI